ncbi:hypothetical protein BH11PLA2_BH11PLA2_51330 [soil metagenome]
MAIYAVTFSEEDNWGESTTRFKTRSEANARLFSALESGDFARLIRWADNRAFELARVNIPRMELTIADSEMSEDKP